MYFESYWSGAIRHRRGKDGPYIERQIVRVAYIVHRSGGIINKVWRTWE